MMGMPPFDRSKFPPINDEERRLILEGNRVHAIISYRNRHTENDGRTHTYGLFDSKEMIDYEHKLIVASTESFPKAVAARVELLLGSLCREFDFDREAILKEVNRALLALKARGPTK